MAKPGFTWDAADPMARAEGETLNAWAALNDYARMGPGRSLRQLDAQYREQSGDGGRTPCTRFQTLADWSTDHAWQARVEAFDAAEFARQQDQYQAWIDAERERRQRLLERAHEMMPELFEAVDKRKVRPADLAQLVRTISDASRKETRDEVTRAEHSGPGGTPIQTEGRLDPAALALLERAIEAGAGVSAVEEDDA